MSLSFSKSIVGLPDYLKNGKEIYFSVFLIYFIEKL